MMRASPNEGISRETLVQRRVRIYGRVQGVGFRQSTKKMADGFKGLRGAVGNCEDGSVEAVFLGPVAAVLQMVAWCRTGPPAAEVKSLEVTEERVDERLGAFAISSGNISS